MFKGKNFSAWKARSTAAALMLVIAAGAAEAGTSRGFENGGKFVRFDPVVAEFNRSGAPFRIVGLCQSACTLFLSIRNMCVERSARFEFHAGNDGHGNISTYATRHMLDAYNPKLRRFVIANGYMTDFTFHAISGDDMIDKFGYPECTRQHRLQTAEVEPPADASSASEGSYVNRSRPRQMSALRGAEGSYTSR